MPSAEYEQARRDLEKALYRLRELTADARLVFRELEGEPHVVGPERREPE